MLRASKKGYNQEAVNHALFDINQGASLRAAAARYNVPRSTLSDKVG
jgi:hypothetical protein